MRKTIVAILLCGILGGVVGSLTTIDTWEFLVVVACLAGLFWLV